MKIVNPWSGAVVADVPADNANTVAAKYARARAAQPRWAATPMKTRLAAIAAFRAAIVAREDELARTLTLEVGKPIRQSRNELKGLLGRIDFFLEKSAATLRDAKVLDDKAGKLEERISHEPLGVIANISAWN